MVYLLHNGYDGVLSAHASPEDAEKAKRDYLSGEVVKDAWSWWQSFGPDSEFEQKYHHKTWEGKSFEEFLAVQAEAAESSLYIEEMEMT